ncbi:MAG: AAA family ATPase [Prochloraceae cyanobacterium]|nr:AAA family ATPase [Prochloraceae cyanobacterium]
MEAVIFMGIQASGKSTFYRDRFFNTHMRINLDMLKTRHREKIIFRACLEAKQRFVIDNTNPTIADRERYIPQAKEKGFYIVGYYFYPDLEACKQRNQKRSPKQIIPLGGILATYKKLKVPSYKEGFDKLYSVKIGPNNSFIVDNWKLEI